MRKFLTVLLALVMLCTAIPALAESDPVIADENYDPYRVLQQLAEQNAANQLKYAPKVTTLENGVQVQRTPQDGEIFNTYILKSDARGCYACHTDLTEQVLSMPQGHMQINLVGDIDLTITGCINCHEYTHGYVPEDYGMAMYMHGLHSTQTFTAVGGTCMSCHDVDMKTGEYQLWDEVKYNRYRGIMDIAAADAEGTFTFDQTTQSDPHDIFCTTWNAGFSDYTSYDGLFNGVQPDPKQFDTWTVTVEGMVDNPFTMTLPELIETFGSETKVMTMHCTYDPAPGGLITTNEVTGVPVDKILEYAGVQEGAIEVYFAPEDGACTYPVLFEHYEKNEALLVYEINGERLSLQNGYPLCSWNGGMGAPSFAKMLSKLIVAADPVEDLYLYTGWEHEGRETGYMNKPSCAILHMKDGQIVPAYEPLTIEGFADAFDDPIVAIEISLDRGATWMTFPTEGAKTGVWTHWTYTFTPQEGPYVVTVRAVTEAGRVSESPDVRLINAK